MDEAKDLKVGMSVTFTIGETVVKMKPITLGKMKAATTAFQDDVDAFDMIVNYLVVVLDNGDNPFATKEWIKDNVTMPVANDMIDAARKINGLGGDFFTKGATGTEPIRETRDLIEKTPTPSV